MIFKGVVLAMVMLGVCIHAKHHRKCAKGCTCQFEIHKMICKGNTFHYHYIPKIPKNITTVVLESINLGYVTDDMTHNLTSSNVSSLTLTKNNITGFSPSAFKALIFLETLVIEQNILPFKDLSNVYRKMGSELLHLTLKSKQSSEGEYEVDSKIFVGLQNLKTLTLNLHRMKRFNATSLSGLWNLSKIDLSDGVVVDLIIDRPLINVTHVSLKGNNFVEVPPICKNRMPMIPRLKQFDLENNAIRDLDVSTLACLKNLQRLTLTRNRIEHLRNNVFANLPKLNTLFLNRLWTLKSIEPFAFNSSSLFKLMLQENPSLSIKNCKPGSMFKYTPNLSSLDLTSTKLHVNLKHLTELLLTLKNVHTLMLQGVGIQRLPMNTFSHLPNLTYLSLEGNEMSHWNQSVFGNVTSIRTLILGGCNIKIIRDDFFPLEFRLSVKEINLANNPFTCTCDLLWFKTWMDAVRQNHSIKFSQFPHRYECRSPNTKRLRLIDFHPTVESCSVTSVYSVILTIVFGVFLLFFIVSLVIFRYRWFILYWISLLRRRRLREGCPPAEIVYDGFISYSNPDYDWICKELIGFLENELHLKLCEHSRDFAPGKYITDNVIDAIDTSRKTMLVISNAYMQSDWCKFELQMALSCFLKQEIEIVVVLLEHIKSCHVTSSLRALMVTSTYIEWSDDLEAKQLFRQRLQNAFES